MPARHHVSPPALVLLVRHGRVPTTGKELPAAGQGPNLSEEGQAEVSALGRLIASLRPALPPLTCIYASPLARTLETASLLAKVLGLVPQEEPRLVDTGTGTWAGLELAALSKQPGWATVVHQPSAFRFPEGEAMLAMQARAVSTVRSFAAEHRGESIIAVSHADPIKAVLADALGMYFDLFQRLVIAPASLSAVLYGDEGPRVIATNWLASPGDFPTLVPRRATRRRQ
ncbi:MAG: histidine phosphatase family protein [Acidimicrobiales bacterium]